MEYWRQVYVDSFAYSNNILQKSCQHYLKIDVVADVASKLSKIFVMIRMSKKKIYNLSSHQIFEKTSQMNIDIKAKILSILF